MGNEEVTDLDHEEVKLRQDMEDTRSSMTEKLEALENKVASTVEGAANAVTETVESVKGAVEGTVDAVKDSVQGTVNAVKNSLDMPLQVDRHPWAMVCGSVAVGFVAGRLLGGTSTSTGTVAATESAGSMTETSRQLTPARKPQKSHGNGWSGKQPASGRSAGRADSEPGMLSKLTQQFAPEIEKLKGLAIGSMLGLVRDMIHKATPPEVGSQIAQMIDDVTTKLGGKPISGSVSNFFSQGQSSEEVCPPGQKDAPVGAASFPGRGGFER